VSRKVVPFAEEPEWIGKLVCDGSGFWRRQQRIRSAPAIAGDGSMIGASYVRHAARYNRWQNEIFYAVVDTLPEAERRRERGAFFGSIHSTLNHHLSADQIWMSRFAGTRNAAAISFPKPTCFELGTMDRAPLPTLSFEALRLIRSA
jgi:hypothetical protein